MHISHGRQAVLCLAWQHINAERLAAPLGQTATPLSNILTKTGTAKRTEAAAYALRRGLLAQ
jgi:hypothetical protein